MQMKSQKMNSIAMTENSEISNKQLFSPASEIRVLGSYNYQSEFNKPTNNLK